METHGDLHDLRIDRAGAGAAFGGPGALAGGLPGSCTRTVAEPEDQPGKPVAYNYGATLAHL